MTRNGWNLTDIPDQTGVLAVITGANSGIGYETARALAAKNATVVMACRNLEKATQAADAIRRETPNAELELAELELASLGSVRHFAETFSANHPMFDLLINNAGVMIPPYGKTEDGFELQIGVNHFGHFALTGLLLAPLLAAPAARVVNVSSGAHRMGRIDFEDLHSERSYRAWRAYGQSKLANLLFTLELDRRLREAGSAAIVSAAHPGTASTNLQASSALATFMVRLFGQDQQMAALPTLYAATASDVNGNDFIGPDGFMEQRGHPKKVGRSAAASDRETAQRLWELSVKSTGVDYASLASS